MLLINDLSVKDHCQELNPRPLSQHNSLLPAEPTIIDSTLWFKLHQLSPLMCLIAEHSVPEIADSTTDNFLQIFQKKMEERHKQLKESGTHLIKSICIKRCSKSQFMIFLSGFLMIHLL